MERGSSSLIEPGGTRGISSLPEWLVRRTSEMLGSRRATRRGFLAGSAVVGSALAMEPVKFAFRPMSAYDTVCGADSACADGYTVFCCTINNGANLCPGETFIGGWWKADDSGFCCGGPRYYIDCNAYCGSSWTCECEDSPDTCDNRRIACNQFRYGQCNLQISCYGPVVCRVVTCTAPWVYDSACDSTSATDEETVSHSAPCLPGDCPSPIIMWYYDMGGPGSFLGAQLTSEAPAPAGGGTWVEFANGAIYDVSPEGMHFVAGPLWTKYESLAGPVGVLGYPTTNQLGTPDGVGQYNDFANDGAIYWTPNFGAWSIHGAIRDKWAALGFEQGLLGYPVTDEYGTPDGVGRYNQFAKLVGGQVLDNGSIYWTPEYGAWSIHGAIRQKWIDLDWEQGPLGYPITDETGSPDGVGRYNHFAKLTGGRTAWLGGIYWTPTFGAWSIHGKIWNKWSALGWEQGVLGYPVTDEQTTPDGVGRYNQFAKLQGGRVAYRGAIYWAPGLGAWSVHGKIWEKWSALDWEQGVLGYPVSDELTTADGKGRYNLFSKLENGRVTSHGSIYWSPATGAHPVYGAILALWTERGRESGSLGYPVADPMSDTVGDRTIVHQQFQHGSLYSSSG